MAASLAAAPAPAADKNDAQARELLRRAASQQSAEPPRTPPAGTGPAIANAPSLSVGHPTRAELDQQYLDGRLTAKQFQKALAAWLQEEQKRPAPETEKQRKEAAQRAQQTSKTQAAAAAKAQPQQRAAAPRSNASNPAPVASLPPTAAPPTNQPTPQQAKISEVEARLDQMLRQKEAREQAALTNAAAVTNNVPAGPQTKRQRLDALLRRFIQGTLPEAEYNVSRAKILAEPD